ncbi:MAG: hypothetical protein Q4C95_02190 [Planctomycetia bacterium]|nr:hypothetical protein [Planctomycetia bacterium]
MAMARTQGVTIALIIFIILTLTFGVLSYFMGQGYSETAQKLKESEGKVQSAENDNRTLSKNLEDLIGKTGFVGYDVKDVSKLIEDMESDIQKAFINENAVPSTYKDAVETLGNYFAKIKEENKTLQENLQKSLEEQKRQISLTQEQKAQFEKDLEAARTDFQKTNDDNQAKLQAIEAKYQQLTKELDDKKLSADEAVAQAKQLEADSTEAVSKIVNINEDLRDQLEQMNKLMGISLNDLDQETRELLSNKVKMDFDVPNGKVLYVDQSERTIRLNIGKADGVQPLTKFGVFEYDTMNVGGAVPKGSVEIIRILSDHESIAKILTDEMTNPIMPEDLIYTPLWTTGDKRKYVLDSQLDIDNDGKSDLNKLITLIRSSGAEVVGWINDEGVIQSFDADGDIVSQMIMIDENDPSQTIDISKKMQWIDENNNVIEFNNIIKPGLTALITNGVINYDEKIKANVVSPKIKNRLLASHNLFIASARECNVPQLTLSDFMTRINYKETVNVTKYQEEGGIDNQFTGSTAPVVSTAPVAPIYIPGKIDKQPISSGNVSPQYGNNNDKYPTSTGKVSDYYFRKRTP